MAHAGSAELALGFDELHVHPVTRIVICALAAEFGLERLPLSAATSNQYSPVVRDGLVHDVPTTPAAAA